ncbi:Vacuolar ATP synthase subunit C [Coemansia sp. Benny D160-2]|nr:Vacuolar ATP synthase subunit C [Coemansia sp. Benny D160-2]
MTLYWLLSVPAQGDGHIAWRDVKNRVGDSEVYDFTLPMFKIGTLDTLVRLSDELAKYDASYENTTGKFIDTLKNLTGASNASLASTLVVEDKSVDQYIRTFSWNNSRFRSDKALPEIISQIAEAMGSIEASLKTKMTQYNAIKNSLATVKRKQTGNLSVRSLNGIVRREDCLSDSEYMRTAFVAVPKNLTREWANSYEHLADMVVPRSSKKIADDAEYVLYSVVLFKRVFDEFSNKARDARFIVRDYVYDEDEIQKDRVLAIEVVEQEEELLDNITEWLKGSFGDVVSAWIHIKALRVFVESILRYGIPPDFLPILVKPNLKQASKIKQQLNEFFSYLETSASASARATMAGKAKPKPVHSSDDSAFDMQEFSNILSDYTPFVFFDIPWTFLDSD